MAVPVAGSVMLQNNHAVIVLPVVPAGQPARPLQGLLDQVMAGEVPVHESRQPVHRKHLAAMVCNIQNGLKLTPLGFLGAWSAEASTKLLHTLTMPKVARGQGSNSSPLCQRLYLSRQGMTSQTCEVLVCVKQNSEI